MWSARHETQQKCTVEMSILVRPKVGRRIMGSSNLSPYVADTTGSADGDINSHMHDGGMLGRPNGGSR